MKVIPICQDVRSFTYEEAMDLLPLVKRIVEESEIKVARMLADQRFFIKIKHEERLKEIDKNVVTELQRMGTMLVKLGCKVFGMGHVSFPAMTHLWSWKYGEESIAYWHGVGLSPLKTRYRLTEAMMGSKE